MFCLRTILWLGTLLFCLLMAIILSCCMASSLHMLTESFYVAFHLTWNVHIPRNFPYSYLYFCFFLVVHNISRFPRISYLLLVIHNHSNFAKVGLLAEICCLPCYSWLWRSICMCTEIGRRVKPVAKFRSSCFSEGTSHFSPRNFTVSFAQGCLMGLSMASLKSCGNNTQTRYFSFLLHSFFTPVFFWLTASASSLEDYYSYLILTIFWGHYIPWSVS